MTRSPLFRADRQRTDRSRSKASECARAVLDLSYATDPVVRWAASRIEDLGVGAFAGCHAVIAAIDRMTVRARLTDMTRLLDIPLIECGFHAPRGQVPMYPNRER